MLDLTKFNEAIVDIQLQYQTKLQDFMDKKNAALAQVAVLQAKITTLLPYRPFDPRSITAEAFLGRLYQKEMVTLYGSDDPTTQAIAATLHDYVENNWPVLLDSADTTGPLAYLASTGLLTSGRVTQLLADASQSEAYLEAP